MSSFDGMCTLVTGSASGLGAAPAVALARGGTRMVITTGRARGRSRIGPLIAIDIFSFK
jgi:NAD(P)-dependent dehydrogenase (short-subunit alcohol dehydrogenase family)